MYKWYNMYMAVLNLRGVPDRVAQKLKADAALSGSTLRDYCVLLLSGRTSVIRGLMEEDGPRLPSTRRTSSGRNSESKQAEIIPAAPTKCTDPLLLSGRGVDGHAQSAGSYPNLASRTISTVAKADAEQVLSPVVPTKCSDTQHHGFQRSDGYWCVDCRRMY